MSDITPGRRRGRIYPVAVKPPSGIGTWNAWPEDVHDTLREWNRSKGLSFVRTANVFKCEDCEAFCRAHEHGAAVLRDRTWLCDDCLITRARTA